MVFQIERLGFEELCIFLCFQAEDSFPDLKDENRLKMLAEKWSKNAEFSTCRDEKGILRGMIAFYANGQGAEFAYIPHVYVSPGYRKMGLFSRMLTIVEKHVREKGFSEIKLEVDSNNLNAQNTYLRKGFVLSGSAKLESNYMIKQIQL